MRLLIAVLAVAVVLGAGFFLSPIDPAPWEAPDAAEAFDVGRAQPLANLTTFATDLDGNPDSFAVDAQNHLLAGLSNGDVLMFDRRTGQSNRLAATGGFITGLAWDDADARVYAADEHAGRLFSIDASGRVSVALDNVNGEPIRMPNDLDMDGGGVLYFTDSTTRHTVAQAAF